MKLTANISLKNSASGGRQNAVFTGYRPTLRLADGRASDCVITVLNVDSIKPGSEGSVEIKILHPQRLGKIAEIHTFIITEGKKEIGNGHVLKAEKFAFQPGDIVSYNHEEAELIEKYTLFGIEKAKIKILRSGQIVETTIEQLEEHVAVYSDAKITYIAIAAKIKAEVATQRMLAPIESNIIPLPHQILALEKVMTGQYLRFLMADEVGMGKTIETGLILKELKLRGIVKRILIIVPKSAMGQWQQEMKRHFNEVFHLYDTDYINTLTKTFARLDADNAFNLFTQHNQVIVSMDALKPMEARQGWTKQKVSEYNQYRIESVLAAEFDLLVIDECHKVGGSNTQVGRFQMADILCSAIPNVLLLSATPHRGKSDHFRRILQLLDADAFSGEGMPSLPELEPYVVRTEKRQAIDYNGQKLFNKRHTYKIEVQLDPVLHRKQKQLYEAVTEYVVEGFNRAKQTNNNSHRFVMILFQWMMSSSTQAILDAMQKRADRLSGERQDVNPETIIQNLEEYAYESQYESDFEQKILSMVAETRANYDSELSTLQRLIRDAKDCLDQETDAKVAYLLDKLAELKRSEQNPDTKFLVFTGFTSTQSMLKKILQEKGGYLCEAIHGGMNIDQRIDALKKFKDTTQVLICTDAAGESLNMQFAHIVINYDMPWNPMVLEQRIGRVDRIGQSHEVLAFNMMLDNSVDKRVYEVIEVKLNQILDQLGIDKTADVLDSTMEREQINRLYLTSLLDPAKFEQESNTWLDQIKDKLKAYKSTESILPTVDEQDIKAEKVDAVKHSPLPKWLEVLTSRYLQTKGIAYQRLLDGVRFVFPGYEENIYTFNIRESLNNPIPEPVSLQHPMVQTMLQEAVPFTASQPIPILQIRQSGATSGYWSLWHLEVKNEFETSQITQPIFISDEGAYFAAFAQTIWDKLIQDSNYFDCIGTVPAGESAVRHAEMTAKAESLMQHKYDEMEKQVTHHADVIKTNKEKSFVFQEKQMSRIGIDNIRQFRLKRLLKEKESWEEQFHSAKQVIPSFSCLLIARIVHE